MPGLPIRSCLLALLFALSIATQADAASLTLTWDPPTDRKTAGYLVLYGTARGRYTTQIDVGLVTQRRLDGLVEGVTYYFAVRAYDSSRRASELSAMVSGIAGTSGGTPTGPIPVSSGKWPGGAAGDLRAVIRADRHIDIAWTPAAGAPDGYRVEVGASFGETDVSALTRDLAIVFDMTDLPADAYFLRVRPIFGAGPSYVSEELVVAPNSPVLPDAPASGTGPWQPCGAAPGAPRQLRATAQDATVSLGWQPGPGDPAATYAIQVGIAPGVPNAVAGEVAASVTSVTATAPPAAYALRLAGVNACGASVWAPEARLYVGVTPLPGMPRALAGDISGGVVTLTWQPPATGGPPTRYLIEALTPAGPWVVDTGHQGTALSNANPPPGLYVVTVRAGNATGFGPATSPVLVSVPHE